MAVRIREGSGKILCAAMYPAKPKDCYIDDGVHYMLSVVKKLLVTEPMELPYGVGRGGHARHGEWWWHNEVPEDVVIESWPE
jgi:hypothetical protein